MATQHPFSTLRDVLRHAVTRFGQAKLSYGHGNANAYDEAAYLLLHTLSLPLDTLDPFLDAALTDAEIEKILDIVEKRATDRIPAAYLTNEAWMHGYRFYVDERTIVPRSLIGELLVERLAPWVGHPDGIDSVLELCTGSGCLAIMAADAFPDAAIDAVDLSGDALDVARRNVDDYMLEERISLHQGDLFAPLPAGRRYKLIITNPPYVNDVSMSKLPVEYQREPTLALAGGEDGMDVVRRIVEQARNWLTDDGMLIVEIGNERRYAEAAFGGLDPVWLSTSAGDDAVFLLHAGDLPD
jgi:ribosomal protein L3 glutamine methyltransferase